MPDTCQVLDVDATIGLVTRLRLDLNANKLHSH